MKKLLFLLFTGVMAYAQPNIGQPDNLSVCEENFDGFGYFNLTLNNENLLQDLNPAEYTVTYHETQSAAQTGTNPLNTPQQYHSVSAVVFARVTEIADFSNYTLTSFSLTVLPRPIVPTIPTQYYIDNDGMIDGNLVIDLTVLSDIALDGDTTGEIEISYYTSQSDVESGTNPIVNINNFLATTQTLYVKFEIIITGCTSTAPFDIVVYTSVPAPTGDSIQNYTSGQTLADLDVEGQNILWYPTNGTGNDTGETETPLPATTVLINAVTYYASQTIQGEESSERLAVTAYDVLLNLDDAEFAGIIFYPNPVTDKLNIKSTSLISSYTVANSLGQKISEQKVNGIDTAIDFSNLASGTYFLKINLKSDNKTMKIVKK